MIKVWFNHWFSTVYRLIELMKEDEREEIYVIGTNQQKNAVIQLACDEWYEEPVLYGDDYIGYCLDFCREHGIEVFVPRKNMADISRNKEKFQEAGVRVMADDYELISLLGNKSRAYELFRDCPSIHVPEFYVVNTAAQFRDAYGRITDSGAQACIKFVKDEGGMSFRRITGPSDRFLKLKWYPGREISYEELDQALSGQESFDDMMVMPNLPDQEISVDCLRTPKGLIAVPRFKSAARHERVSFDREILDMAQAILDRVELQCPCNIQFKRKDNIPYLLEINTRMSGGLQMSCLAAGVNIPNLALNKLLGRELDWTLEESEKTVTYVELPRIIGRSGLPNR